MTTTDCLKNTPETNDMQQFLNEIRQYPLLDEQEERQLAMACAAGDEDAVRRMVNCNLRLVVSLAKKYMGRGVPLLDLIQEGSISLLSAARNFDYTKDFSFSTYATACIRNRLGEFVSQDGIIRVPSRAAGQIKKIVYVQSQLRQELGYEPDPAQIAARADMEQEKVAQYLKLAPEICSLDVPAGDGEDTLQTLLEDVHAPQPQEKLVRQELERIIQALLEQLTQRQQQVIRLRYGLEDGIRYTSEDTGKKLGISKQRVGQIEKEAVCKLQKRSQGLGLEDFLIDG